MSAIQKMMQELEPEYIKIRRAFRKKIPQNS